MRFGPYLAAALVKAGYTQRSFAKKARHHQQNFNQILKGKRPPPLKHLAAWSALLGEHIDPARFQELAELEHCPPGIREKFAAQQDQIKKLTKPDAKQGKLRLAQTHDKTSDLGLERDEKTPPTPDP